VLAAWSGWGAVPQLFDEQREEWAQARAQVRELAGEHGYEAARRTTINAHYTDSRIAAAIWQAVTALGFTGGRVLEPGCGAGIFLALAPAEAQLVGVELDPTTAQIARALYPDADIRAESFAHTRLPDAYFDLTVGNVPFADVRLHDPRHNPGAHSLHNHFILKSLHLTRPGGLVAVLSSHYTLDAANPAARREMRALADLVGAVRLPTGAHRRVAGTDALMDLLILRRRHPEEPARETSWENTRLVDVDDRQVRINSYLAEHPQRFLGELAIGQGMYGADTLHVRPRSGLEDTPAQLTEALGELVDSAREQGLVWGPRAPSRSPAAGGDPAQTPQLAPEGVWDGHIAAEPDGAFTVTSDGLAEPLKVPASHRSELRALLKLRDTARSLLAAEASTLEDTAEIAELRSQLGGRYRDYQRRYGPINRFTLRRTGRTDPNSGEERMARVTPTAVRLLRSDPFAALVQALENFDETTQTATPAGILAGRVVVPRAPRLGADTPQDALAICLDTRGRVDLGEIAHLLGTDPGEARVQLGELVYEDPPEQRLVAAAEYLSGNVRAKLEHARHAAIERPELEGNVRALERVLPADLTAEEIEPRLGAVWIDADTHRQFLAEILEDPDIQDEHPGGAMWAVKGRSWSVQATSVWGTERMPAPALAKAVLEQRPIQVTDEIDDGRRVVNPTETAAAQEKAQALQERFSEWCWEDPDRGRRLAGEYNRRFNAIVLRDYSTEGDRLTLPGLARTFQPRAHQRAAVARMLAEPAVGLFHQVGAGKTAEMVIGAMELRRLGLVSKPGVVVPNHTLEQFSREWLQLYPQARVLAASSDDLAGERRRAFVARTAANDWDAVILTRSAFARLPVSAETKIAYTRRELAQLRAMLEHSKGAGGLTVKRLEKQILREEERLQALLDSPRDPGLEFEQTGIDYLIVEAHDYKNLQTVSNIRDAAIDGSQRASDLHMKLEWLRDRHGDRVATMATATPIANSITEAHVMTRYLRPDLLQAAGIDDFDAWAATFGQTVTEIEVASTGGGDYRMHTRFARFQNVPEMLRLWHVFADVKTAEDLQLPAPELAERADGQRAPETVLIDPSPELQAYVDDLSRRADAVRGRMVTPEEDNMLKVTTDGRKAALDTRLVTGQKASIPGKLDHAADTIARLWREHRDQIYRTPSGDPSPITGALQIVFCDLSTPNPDRWNAYDELRQLLAGRGLPAEQIRFIHEARNDAEKGRLFAACRAGHVSVLVGSTEKMGVGTNIQDRCIAIHHLDCPWRPADIEHFVVRAVRLSRVSSGLPPRAQDPVHPVDPVRPVRHRCPPPRRPLPVAMRHEASLRRQIQSKEQRDGRGVRQGNQNPNMHIIRYATQGSFDTYSWQTVERKARFINQVMRGRLDVREIEDIGENTLSFAEVKALASGDPLILEKAKIDAEVTRLARLERAWQRAQHTLRGTIAGAEDRAHALAEQINTVGSAAERRTDTRGDLFRMTVDGRHVASRAEAAELLSQRLQQLPYGQRVPIGELGNLPVDGEITASTNGRPVMQLTLHGLPAAPATLERAQLADGSLSLVRQLEHRAATLPELRDRLEADRDAALREQAAAREQLGRPFKYADHLTDARDRQRQIHEQISTRHAQNQQPEPTPTAAADPVLATRAAAFPNAPSARPPTAMPAADPSHLPPRPPVRGPARGR
jgi:N12 class adenine-specific DNA methylase/SAM-dependent methyltransferase